MVGPGTGIAAFRSFLSEREARGASGRNWLFFGEQHFLTDFLYQTEIQYFLESGVLQQLDLAFSRDQKEKIYVQHRMKEKGAELFRWLESGASFYVSGKRDPMSKDVEEALLEIIREFGGKTETEACDYLKKLSDEGRYKKDVY
jgi:sulfite reductase (NADPH) flavoprotein alpha-component